MPALRRIGRSILRTTVKPRSIHVTCAAAYLFLATATDAENRWKKGARKDGTQGTLMISSQK
jgi:hypothetical protein